MPRIFTRNALISSIVLILLLTGCLTVIWSTREAMAQLPFLRAHRTAVAQRSDAVVDTRPWQTAQQLAPMAVSAEEVGFAREAERLAGHEVDQAFGIALRQAQATMQHCALSGAARTSTQKVNELADTVKQDRAHVESLTSTPSANTTDDLEIAKAQLDVDSDQLADAQQDLARLLGDQRQRLQQELSEHEAAVKKAEERGTQQATALASTKNYRTLIARLSAWLDQSNRSQLILAAQAQASADAKTLLTQHNQTENAAIPSGENQADTAARLAALKNRSLRSQMLSIFDDRIETEQQLSSVYQKWSAQVALQHRIVLNLLMRSIALVFAVALLGIAVSVTLKYLLDNAAMDRRRRSMLRMATRLAIQLVCAVVILFIVFGVPSEMPTILGLTTAGLTVVLQDFIISICGWFVLLGRNGIRVGDWVEINGVSGEVADIGLFRTTLIETGNWTDQGHPTGRRVAFLNSFTIKGQYFNFSTTGQWLWDELKVNIAASINAYTTAELIHQAVAEATQPESALAETEWGRLGQNHTLNQFSAAPAVELRPGGGGIDVVIRYVTRASHRFQLKNLLYQKVIRILQEQAESPNTVAR